MTVGSVRFGQGVGVVRLNLVLVSTPSVVVPPKDLLHTDSTFDMPLPLVQFPRLRPSFVRSFLRVVSLLSRVPLRHHHTRPVLTAPTPLEGVRVGSTKSIGHDGPGRLRCESSMTRDSSL